MLPHDVIDILADEAAAAAAAVTTRQAEVQELSDQREEARAENAEVLGEQRALDKDTRVRLEYPLNQLRGRLDVWAQAVTQALTHLDASDQHQAPKAPAQSEIAEVRTYASELSTTTSTSPPQATQPLPRTASASAPPHLPLSTASIPTPI